MSLVSSLSWGEQKIEFDWEEDDFQEIYCECKECHPSTINLELGRRAFLFLREEVIGFTVETGGSDKVRVVENNYGKFGRTPNHFSWRFSSITYSLDRKTLNLEIGSTINTSKDIYACLKSLPTFFGNDLCVGGKWNSTLVDGYKNGLIDDLIDYKQKELDKSMVGNQM
jgi:hypothetical protein